MKALSLTQPWASLVVCGLKHIETRSWSTEYRGPLLIHASSKFPKEAKALCDAWPFSRALYSVGYTVDTLPTGALLGTVDVRACVRADIALTGPVEPEQSFGDFSEGRWAWVLDNAYVWAKPVPFKGMQRIFNVPDEAVSA